MAACDSSAFGAFKRRFGVVGEALAHSLPHSLDVLGVVAEYALCGTAARSTERGSRAKLLFSFGAPQRKLFAFESDRPEQLCHCVTTSTDGSRIWTAAKDRLAVFDADGKHLFSMHDITIGFAYGIAVDSKDQALISSYRNHYIVVCNPDGSVKRTIGSHGAGRGQLNGPKGLALYGHLLFVVDGENTRVTVFNKETGECVRTWTTDDRDASLQFPFALCINSAGEVYVVDCHSNRIQVYDQKGTFLRDFRASKEFSYPLEIAVDCEDTVFVHDTGNGVIRCLTSEGKQITQFPLVYSSTPLGGNSGLHVDRENRVFMGDGCNNVNVFVFPV